MILFQLEKESLRPVLETIVGVEGLKPGLTLYIDESLELFAEVRGIDDVYLAEELGVKNYFVKKGQRELEFKWAVSHILAARWARFIEKEGDAVSSVYSTVLLPLYFGPTRYGLQWARVAASTAVLYNIYQGNADLGWTLGLIGVAAAKIMRQLTESQEVYQRLEIEYAAWESQCRRECLYKMEELCNFDEAVCDDCLKWLLGPYLRGEEPGRALHELAQKDKVVVVATETFSPAHLYILGCVDTLYLIYTPNVYRQVKYALRVCSQLNCKMPKEIKRILVSSYNPLINYEILSRTIGDEKAYYHPKLTGPMAIYLALKKVEKKYGKLCKVDS